MRNLILLFVLICTSSFCVGQSISVGTWKVTSNALMKVLAGSNYYSAHLIVQDARTEPVYYQPTKIEILDDDFARITFNDIQTIGCTYTLLDRVSNDGYGIERPFQVLIFTKGEPFTFVMYLYKDSEKDVYQIGYSTLMKSKSTGFYETISPEFIGVMTKLK